MADDDGSIVAAREMGPGYAWLHVEGIWSAQTRLTVRSVDAQQRHSLGRSGWQDAPDPMAPKEIRHGEGGSRVLLGPDICDHMQPMNWYNLTLTDADKYRSFQNVSWPTVPLAGRSKQGAFIVPEKRAAAPVAAPIRPAPAVPPPPVPPVPADEAQAAGAAEANIGTETATPTPAPAPAKTRGGKGRLVLLGALLLVPLLLLVAAGIAYFGFGCRWDPLQCGATAVAQVTPPEPPEIQPQAAATPVSPPAEETAAAPPVDGPEQWWATIRNPATSADALLELGQRLQSSAANAEQRDIGYEAIYAAAAEPRNSVKAQYLVAESNDPLNPDVGETAGNPVTALTFYDRAKANGSAEAQPRLEALCTWAAQRQAGPDQTIREAYESYCR